MKQEVLRRVIGDAIAQKRVVKWGYVRQFGGLYPAECDTVASHSNAVAILANILASEINEEVIHKTGEPLALEDIALLGPFHDFGECRSGDTGAASFSISGVCKLYSLEREGLEANLKDLKCSNRILSLWDDYQQATSPEAMVVRTADIIEGVEKALHSAKGSLDIINQVKAIIATNKNLFEERIRCKDRLGKISQILLVSILLPSLKILSKAYQVSLIKECGKVDREKR